MRNNQGARLREKSQKQAAGDTVSESSDDSDIAEELGYISPLENVNPYTTFKQALTGTFLLISRLSNPRLRLILIEQQM